MLTRPSQLIPGLFASASAAMVAGCAGPGYGEGFDAPDPGARLHAIPQTVKNNDRTAIPRLVSLLDSDDPVVRMLSIRALEEMTGQTLQYDYAAPLHERYAAVGRWNGWLVAEGFAPTAMPADGDDPLAVRSERLNPATSPARPQPPSAE